MQSSDFESRYEIIKTPLDKGGFGQVFKAKDRRLDDWVAIKMIIPDFAEDPKFFAMLQDEAILTRKLKHPNIVKIHDFDPRPNRFCIVMEYIRGIDLTKFIHRFREQKRLIPEKIALYIIDEVCQALDYAHNAKDETHPEKRPLNIIHRDVSPSNIMLTFGGDIKVIDFGIAKAEFSARSTRTTRVELKGKWHYLSPEHADSTRKMDRRSDIFPLGAILYEILTGEKLFDAQLTTQVITLVRDAYIPPRKFESSETPISSEIQRIIKKAAEKDLEKRYQSAVEMHADIEDYLARLGVRATELKRQLHDLMVEFDVLDDGRQMQAETVKKEITEVTPPLPVPTPPKIPAGAGSELDTRIVSRPQRSQKGFTFLNLQETLQQLQKTVVQHTNALGALLEETFQKIYPKKLSNKTLRIAVIATGFLALVVFLIMIASPFEPSLLNFSFQYRFRVAANLDSTLIFVNGRPLSQKTPAEFQWKAGESFALALYHPGFDTLTGLHYRWLEKQMKPEIKIEKTDFWKIQNLADSAAIWQVQGKLSKMVRLNSIPAYAEVYIDNDTTNCAGIANQDDFRLTAGNHHITLRTSKKGFVDESFDLLVDAQLEQKTFVLSRRLSVLARVNKKEEPAKIVNVSSDDGVLSFHYLSANGKPIEIRTGIQNLMKANIVTPARFILQAKRLKITVAWPGYITENVVIQPEQTEVVVDLVKGYTVIVLDEKTKKSISQGTIRFKRKDKKEGNHSERFMVFGSLEPYGPPARQVEPGKYQFEIVSPGYEKESFVEEIKSNFAEKVVKLKPKKN